MTELDAGKIGLVEAVSRSERYDDIPCNREARYWTGGTYDFTFTIPADYPHKPAEVTCWTKIYHPNIDLAGAVCLNILREDWKPVLDINAVIYGLIFLFYVGI
jgi:ubiquitin-conjugating enzyme E2 M